MKMYLCVAIVLLLASAIAGSALDKTETARNWGREERDEEQCPECKCNNLKEGLCVDSTECRKMHINVQLQRYSMLRIGVTSSST
nr:TPA_inf: conotoxin precursor Ggeo03 [Conus judaeus]